MAVRACRCCRGGRRLRPRAGSARRGAGGCSRCGRDRTGRAPAAGPVLPRPRCVDPAEAIRWKEAFRKVDRCVPGAHCPVAASHTPAQASRGDGKPIPGGGTGSGGIWCASAITSTAPKIESAASVRPLRERTIFVTCGRVASNHGERAPGRSGSGTNRLAARRNEDEAKEPRRGRAARAFRHAGGGRGRDDMPVPVRGVTGDHRQRAATLEMHLAGTDCVDGRAIRSRDVDPEVKRPRRPSDTRSCRLRRVLFLRMRRSCGRARLRAVGRAAGRRQEGGQDRPLHGQLPRHRAGRRQALLPALPRHRDRDRARADRPAHHAHQDRSGGQPDDRRRHRLYRPGAGARHGRAVRALCAAERRRLSRGRAHGRPAVAALRQRLDHHLQLRAREGPAEVVGRSGEARIRQACIWGKPWSRPAAAPSPAPCSNARCWARTTGRSRRPSSRRCFRARPRWSMP